MLILFLVSLLLSLILILVNSLLGASGLAAREKLSAFECGFDPKSSSRLPFSLHFFLVALIFLIFDVEITLILPFPVIWDKVPLGETCLVLMFFLLVLVIGVFLEWKDGALDWSK